MSVKGEKKERKKALKSEHPTRNDKHVQPNQSMLKANREGSEEEEERQGNHQQESSPFKGSSPCLSLTLANLFSIYPEEQQAYGSLAHLPQNCYHDYSNNRGLDPIEDFLNMASNFNENMDKMNGLENISSPLILTTLLACM